MNFLWDIAIRAMQQGKKESELFFCQAKDYSPFYEQSFPCLNEKKVENNEVELNLLFRFAHIFQYILARQEEDMQDFRKYFVDAALHVILHTDLRHGLTRKEIFIRKLLEELESGIFWEKGAAEIQLIEPEKRSRIAALAYGQMQTGSSLLTFRKGLLILFPDAVLYQMRAERKKLLLYLECDKSQENERKLQFIQDMFLPVSYQLRVFWKYHFGIIGVDAAMKTDEIAIY